MAPFYKKYVCYISFFTAAVFYSLNPPLPLTMLQVFSDLDMADELDELDDVITAYTQFHI